MRLVSQTRGHRVAIMNTMMENGEKMSVKMEVRMEMEMEMETGTRGTWVVRFVNGDVGGQIMGVVELEIDE